MGCGWPRRATTTRSASGTPRLRIDSSSGTETFVPRSGSRGILSSAGEAKRRCERSSRKPSTCSIISARSIPKRRDLDWQVSTSSGSAPPHSPSRSNRRGDRDLRAAHRRVARSARLARSNCRRRVRSGKGNPGHRVLEKAVAEFPQRPEYHEELAYFTSAVRSNFACRVRSDAVPILRKLGKEFPQRPGHRSQLVRRLTAEVTPEKAIEVLRTLSPEFPDAAETRRAEDRH